MFNTSKFLQKLWNGKASAQGAPAPDGVVSTLDERTIAIGQVWQQVSAAINERDPEDWNAWHWLEDLYYDAGQLFAITISGGRLFRWPVTVAGDKVSVGDPMAVVVSFAESSESESQRKLRQALGGGSAVRQTEDGRWIGCSILCTATVNKLGILDSRKLFDTFVERFKGDGSEYINVLHLGGGASRIGTLRHIWREDKLLVGLYEFTLGDAVAEACARTLAGDEEGYWGGSIEFRHFGEPLLVEVAEGIKLPATHDGELFGYSVARNQDCAAWYTGNLIAMERTMTEKDRTIALELLGDEKLVEQLAERLGDANRTLAGAVTYSVGREGGHSPVTAPTGGDAESPSAAEGNEPVVYELDEAALGQLAEQVAEHRSVHGRYEQLALQFEERVGEALGRIDALTADLEQRATTLNERLGKLEADDQVRYREYDARKPKQPTVKLGIRPRHRDTSLPDVQEESKFAARARERRVKA